tara:strand:+ start:312 stop:2774 length:2463 start_codon:yes stop_codon:yes gene_type:complete
VDSSNRNDSYNPQQIETKWQTYWSSNSLYEVNDDDSKPKWYELTMYPYPSGDLHIGHWYAMAPSDAHARFMRMRGFNVLHPMGFDAFGLPAENAAITRGIHPKKWTLDNIENMKRQLKSMGPIYDWNREVVTCLPEYYKWNQWIFLQFFKNGLAYRDKATVNWCPELNTVLANEQVIDGKDERTGAEVIHTEMTQWFFRITKYADELLDHSHIDWPEKIKNMQDNWVGRSKGVEVTFDISHYGLNQSELKTFTTRIDTLFGVTFIAIAPESPVLDGLVQESNQEEVLSYIESSRRKTEVERLSTEKDKTGVFTGSYAVNRVNGARIPIWVADYVLKSYGTGVVMGVPAHDERDFIFAKQYGLDINFVVAPSDKDERNLEEAYIEKGGIQINSGRFSNLNNNDAYEKIADYLEEKGWGSRTYSYKMRDWLISRQRYWGTPIPILYCEKCGVVPVKEEDLPVLLPDDAIFRSTGESPLKHQIDFLECECWKCGGVAKRETDTMDTFVDSSWYQFRFVSPNYTKGIFDKKLLNEWGSVDQYTGGAEHAVMHLLYARFFTKAMRDIGLLKLDEPFIRLFNQGHILSEGEKMSKSRGNVVSPDDYVSTIGADAVRCYLMFIGPWDQGGSWNDTGAKGMFRWLNRVWEISIRKPRGFATHSDEKDTILVRLVHQIIKRVGNDLEKFKFNTAIAALMELTNGLYANIDQEITEDSWSFAIESLLLLLSPMAPHITEELWERNGKKGSIHNQRFPDFDPMLVIEETITLVVQVNGRVRDKISVANNLGKDQAIELSKNSMKIQQYIQGKEVMKIIHIPNKLVNIVINN